MNPANPVHKTHPLLIMAAVAVVLFCGVGTAAIMGWLPASIGSTPANGATAPAALTAGTAPAQPAGYPLAQTAPPAPAAVAPDSGPVPVPQQAAADCENCGVVVAVHEITTRARGSGVGAAGGALLGGLLGNQIGSGHGRQLATVAGAIGGAVAGNQVEGNMNAHHSYDIVVRMENGKHRTLHRTAAPAWRAGDHVKIVNGDLRAIG